jgi:hypothetical protein
MSGTKSALLLGAVLLTGCGMLDTPEQAAGRCKTEGVGKMPALSGENAHLAGAFLLSQYVEGCMQVKGYRRDTDGKWIN